MHLVVDVLVGRDPSDRLLDDGVSTRVARDLDARAAHLPVRPHEDDALDVARHRLAPDLLPVAPSARVLAEHHRRTVRAEDNLRKESRQLCTVLSTRKVERLDAQV